MTHEEQADLARRCQQGDKNAFGLLYEAFIRPIYNFVYYKTHHQETAEDIVSGVFTKAFDHLGSFDPVRGPFSAWLYQIARNSVIDYYRTKRTLVNIEDAWDLDDGSDMVRDLGAREQLRNVQQYLKALPSEQRDIVIMRVWQGLSYAEISAALGKSEASCKMMYSRTIAKLRESMPLAVWIALLVKLISLKVTFFNS